jgi:hypothetical protein
MTDTEDTTEQQSGFDDLVRLSFYTDTGKAFSFTTSLRETLEARGGVEELKGGTLPRGTGIAGVAT